MIFNILPLQNLRAWLTMRLTAAAGATKANRHLLMLLKWLKRFLDGLIGVLNWFLLNTERYTRFLTNCLAIQCLYNSLFEGSGGRGGAGGGWKSEPQVLQRSRTLVTVGGRSRGSSPAERILSAALWSESTATCEASSPVIMVINDCPA